MEHFIFCNIERVVLGITKFLLIVQMYYYCMVFYLIIKIITQCYICAHNCSLIKRSLVHVKMCDIQF